MSFDPPSHEDDVKRGLGVAQSDAQPGELVDVTLGLDPALLRAAQKLGTALKSEFTFMGADDEVWTKTAVGVLSKLGASATSGESGVVIVTLP